MGLIKALIGATSSTFGDQWLEYFYCDSLDKNVLVAKGQKRVNSKRSSNTKGSDNIISNGSIIAVNEGQCMMIVDQGAIVEFTAEPGEFKYDKSTEGSIFSGGLGNGIFKTIARRFKFGGDTGHDQRVYYFNLKEIVDNKFGTAQPVPFRVVDSKVGLDIDVSVRCNGVFSYKITNPVLFYQNVCGNVTENYTRDKIDSQLKTEFISALQPGFGKLSEMEMRPNQIMTHIPELEKAMNAALDEKWAELRGIEVVSIALGSITLPKEDEELIKELQRKNVYASNPNMAGATLVEAQAQAMKNAAGNPNGAAMGFFGMGMAQNAGGMNAQQFYSMGEQQKAKEQQANSWKCSCGATVTGKFCPECGSKKPEPASANSWKCPTCGKLATGNFCPECGTKKPADNAWKCSCGAIVTGKFCPECGTKRPEEKKFFKCNKCGWTPSDPTNPPKFCPECGDVFNEDDSK